MNSGGGSAVGSSNLRQRVSDQVTKLRASFKPKPITSKSHEEIIQTLFDLGGVISGGAAIALIYNKPIKDVDFYFNNEQAYLEALALTYKNPKFDICWYFNQSYELHDIGIVMCSVYRDHIVITEAAQLAMDSKVSSLFIENIVFPDRTATRLLKYNKRYGIKFKKSEVLAFAALYRLETYLVKQLIEISV